jgi:hypothetical protein
MQYHAVKIYPVPYIVFICRFYCKKNIQYPVGGVCSNTIGDYGCSCKSGTQSLDPKKDTCKLIAVSERAKLTKKIIGNHHMLRIFQ